jgi:uncharacterized membrane protein YtjA (UPF0391 family)
MAPDGAGLVPEPTFQRGHIACCPRPSRVGLLATSRSETAAKEALMLSWALAFLIVAVIAAVLGFGIIAGTAAAIAKVLFFIFLILFLAALLRGRRLA